MAPPPPVIVSRVRIDDLVIDATIRQTHSEEAEVTEHPVEEGADPADHVRPRSATLSLECVQSSTPLTETFNKDTNPAPYGLTSRVRDVDAYLRAARLNGRLLRVVTMLRTYDNMAITSYSATRDAKTGDCLAFSVAFKQVTIVSNQITTTPAGQGKKSLGKKATTPTKSEPENTSTLFDIGRAARRALR